MTSIFYHLGNITEMQCQAYYDLFAVMEPIIRHRLTTEYLRVNENTDSIAEVVNCINIEREFIKIWNAWNCNTIRAAIGK